MSPTPDYIESLGYLTLAHRLKRTMQGLMDESAQLHERMGLPIKPHWGSTLMLLEADGPLPVTELAERLRLKHPTVVQALDEMVDLGLVRRAKDRTDGRRSLLSLTAKGRRWMPGLHELWGHMAKVQEQIVKEADGDLLGILKDLDAALEERRLTERVLDRAERASKRESKASRTRGARGTRRKTTK